jgi:hypothetical protein
MQLTCSDLKDVSRSVSVSIEKNLSFSNFVAQYCLCAAHATHMHSTAITRRGHHGSPWPWWSVLALLFSMECFGLSIFRPEALGTLCCPRPFAGLPAATVAGRVGGIAGSLVVWPCGCSAVGSNHTAPAHAGRSEPATSCKNSRHSSPRIFECACSVQRAACSRSHSVVYSRSIKRLLASAEAHTSPWHPRQMLQSGH